MMRSTTARERTFAFLLTGLCALAFEASALDPPHNGQNSLHVLMSCDACHYTISGPTPSWATQQTTTDETFFNNLCTSCHQPTSMTDSRFVVKTHSSGNTSRKYGNWSVECRICHNPHYQDQVSMYPSDASADLLSGTIGPFVQPPVSALETTIPIAGGGLVANAWIDHTFVPNTAYPSRMYRIKSNTADAVMVYGPVNGRYAAAGSHFAIRLGKLVLGQVPTPYTGKKQVKFFRESGARSFATSTDPADMTSICQVCHENTASFNSRGDLEGPGHPSLQAGGNCTQCHSHLSGFKPACGSCHGNPPIVSTQGGPDGLANNEGGTGSLTTGAHVAHAVSMGYGCENCHAGGMPDTPIYDKLIQIGFNIAYGLYQSGSYDGRASLANGFSYSKGNPGTTVTQAGTKVCSNVYCHGSTMEPNGGADMTPVWDDPATAACGACHGASASVPPTRGSHQRHAGSPNGLGLPCAECHATSPDDHVNGRAEWAFDTVSFPWLTGAEYREGGTGSSFPVPGAYGQCSNLYCHSSGQGITDPAEPPSYKTPTWGQTFSGVCGGACHAVGYAHPSVAATYDPLTSGSHSAHLRYHFDQGGNCQSCHHEDAYSTCDGCHLRKNHVNRTISVAFNPEFPIGAGGASGVYTGDPAPGTAYGSCSDIYCHSPGTKGSPPYSEPNTASYQWGGSLPSNCTGCHGGGNATGAAMTTASHDRHVVNYDYDCSKCHATTVSGTMMLNPATYSGTLTYGYRYHVNGWIDIAFSSGTASSGTYAGQASPVNYKVPGSAYGACGNTYCHSDGTSVATGVVTANDSANWGSPGPLPCDSCHGNSTYSDWKKAFPLYPNFQPKANGHGLHLTYTCNYCHYGTTHDGSTIFDYSRHANGDYGVVPDTTRTVTFSAVTVTVNFTYAFDIGGGQCTNISCHSARGRNPNLRWGDALLSFSVQVSCNPGAACYEGGCSAMVTGGTNPPYTYAWDFGDGTSASTGTLSSVSHIFPNNTQIFTVNASVRDALNRLGTGSYPFQPVAAVNQLPVAANTWTKNGYTVTITDLSYDSDYNTCGNSGPGLVTIWWTGSWITAQTYELNLTNLPSQQTFSHTYASPGTYTVFYDVFDNKYNNGSGARRVTNYITVP